MEKIRDIILVLIIAVVFIQCSNPNEYEGKKKIYFKNNADKINLELVFAKVEENGRLGNFEVKDYKINIDTNHSDCNTSLNLILINKEPIYYHNNFPLRLRSLEIKVDSVQTNGIPFILNSGDSNNAVFKIVNAPPDKDTTIFSNEFTALSDISFGWSRKEKQLWAIFFAKIICLRQKVMKIDTSILIPSEINKKMEKNKRINNEKKLVADKFIRKDTTLFLSRPFLDSLYIRGKFLFKMNNK